MHTQSRSVRYRSTGILLSVCLAALVLPLSFSEGAIATPAIGRDLGGSPVALSWITNAFMLSFGSLLMAAGSIADEWGRKRIFTSGVGLFVLVSIVLGFAGSIHILDFLRAVQGVAAAAALAGGSAALAQEFEGHARTKAFSLLGTTFGVGLAIGPVLAGFLVELLGWRSVFFSTAVIGALGLFLGVRFMHESRNPEATGLDWPGTVCFTAALSLFTFGVIQAPTSGWTSPLILVLFVGSIIFLAAFVLVELRVSNPMLDLSLFRYGRFVGVQALPIATCYCYVVLLVVLPLRLIGIEGYSEIETGILMIALSAPMIFVPFLAAMLTRRFSPAVISAVGLVIAAGGLLWLSLYSATTRSGWIVLPMFLIGFGTGMPWGLMDGLSVSVVPKERAGMATGIFSTARVAGEGVALALVGALLAAFVQHELGAFHPADRLLTSAETRQAAALLATGNLGSASTLLPELGRVSLTQSYATSFTLLLYVLAGITGSSAIIAFVQLGRDRSH